MSGTRRSVNGNPDYLIKVIEDADMVYQHTERKKAIDRITGRCAHLDIAPLTLNVVARNSFLAVVEDQMELWGLPKYGNNLTQEKKCRFSVTNFMLVNQAPRGAINFIQPTGKTWTEYCNEMKCVDCKTDVNFIYALAKQLGHDIIIIVGTMPTPSFVYKISGNPAPNTTAQLIIGYINEGCFLSMQPNTIDPATQQYNLDSLNSNAVNCQDPQTLANICAQSDTASQNQGRIDFLHELEERCKLLNYRFLNPNKRTCLFHAILDQMRVQNFPPVTPDQLYLDVVTLLQNRKEFQNNADFFDFIKCTNTDCTVHSKEVNKKFTTLNQYVVEAIATLLVTDIVVICFRKIDGKTFCIRIKGNPNERSETPFMVGYVRRLHYQSVLKNDPGAPSAASSSDDSAQDDPNKKTDSDYVTRDPRALNHIFDECDSTVPQDQVFEQCPINMRANCKRLIDYDFVGPYPEDIDYASFFNAISWQLNHLGKNAPTPDDLRSKLSDYMKRNPTFMAPGGEIDMRKSVTGDWNQYCQKLKTDENFYVDAVGIIAMARYLKHDILVITSSSKSDNSFAWIPGRVECYEKPIIIGYFYKHNYFSTLVQNYDPAAVVPCAWPRCDQSFSLANAMLKHKMEHTREQFACKYYNVCPGSTYKTCQKLNYHLSRSHTAQDYSDIERDRLKDNCRIKAFRFHGLTLQDGNCFFHAIEDQLKLTPSLPLLSFITLRSDLVEMFSRSCVVQGKFGMVDLSLLLDTNKYRDWDAYLHYLKADGAWADSITLAGMAHMLNVCIHVITSFPDSLQIGEKNNQDGVQVLTFAKGNTTFPLLTIGHQYQVHYESLIPGVQPQPAQQLPLLPPQIPGSTGGTKGKGPGKPKRSKTPAGGPSKKKPNLQPTGTTGQATGNQKVKCPVCMKEYHPSWIKRHILAVHPGYQQP